MMARVRPSPGQMEQKDQAHSMVSLRYDEQAELAEDVLVGSAALNFDEEAGGEEAGWIRDRIKCRECRRYVATEVDSSDDEAVLTFSKKAPSSQADPPFKKSWIGDTDNPSPNESTSQTDSQSIKAKRKHSRVNDRKCQCGYRLSEHRDPESAERNGHVNEYQDWDHKTHASPLPTNAFGEIEFVGYGDKVAKYVRVDAETDTDLLKTLMMDKWKMERPNLLISVTGGAKNFLMRSRLKDAFRRGIMKAALSTGAWIITGGNNAGVMKHVGEAVRDYGLTAEGRVICIGIAPWGCVQNKEVLVSSEAKRRGKWPAVYRIAGKQKSKQSFLDPNHSHFILVDNGTQHKFATEIELRAKLEKRISEMTTNTGSDGVHVPVALLVLEGGPGTLKTVMNAIKNNTPAIIIKGSGKCADVLAYAAQNIKETEMVVKDSDGKSHTETNVIIDSKLQEEIKVMVEETFGKKNAVQHAEWVENCVRRPHLISVYELQSTGGSAGVDMAILKALLKANKDQVMDQLKLALAWNRIDIAKSEIFTDERPWPDRDLDTMMMSAIQLNRVDFVDLFLDNGVSIKDFLTVQRLLKLYNEIPKNSQLYILLSKVKSTQRKHFSLEDVGILLQDLIGDYFEPLYLMPDSKLKDLDPELMLADDDGSYSRHITYQPSAQDLFIWAVLMNQQDLAKLFWREGNESTGAALVANSLLKAMRRFIDDTDIMQRLQNNADEFEDLAIGVINDCYSHDERKAKELLIREMYNWGRATCVLIAVQADNKRFISQTACQSLLNSIWMGKMSLDNSLIRLIPSMFIFPLIWVIIKFQQEERAASETYVPRAVKKAAAHRPALKREPTQHMLNREGTQNTIKGQEKNADLTKEVIRAENEQAAPTGVSRWKKLQIFYTAPVVIFILNCISYLFFLGLYSYILVVQLNPTFHVLEGILMTWVFTIFVEEIRQLVMNYAHSLRSKLLTYLHDSWNRLDIVTILLFVLGIILRFTHFDASRVILAFNLITFFFRILHIFSVNKQLGPKLVMIQKMIWDLVWFVVILMVFIGAYAIASEAILYPETEMSWKLLYYLPRKAYWQIYGELFLEDIEGSNPCTNNATLYNDYQELRCPSEIGRYLVPIMMAGYVLMTNVLLLNLLIAMFSYTFQKIQENTDIHWSFQRFNLIQEYYERPWLPPPFILFSHLFMCLRWCCTGCSTHRVSSDFRKRFANQQDEKKLIQWENIIADTYLTKVEAKELDRVEGRVKVMMLKLDTLQTKMDDYTEDRAHGVTTANQPAPVAVASPVLHAPQPQTITQVIKMPPQLEQRLTNLEEQFATTYRALNWIMQSMEASNMTCSVTPPQLGSPRKQSDYKEAERQKEKKRQAALKEKFSKKLSERLDLHVVSRSPVYPNSYIYRYPVADDAVPWDVDLPDYDPVNYTADSILRNPPYADAIDLLNIPVKDRTGKYLFNDVDSKSKVSRISYEGSYQVVNGLPLNPRGRTGLEGRGLLGRWGPNIAGDPIITRWKRNDKDENVLSLSDGKPVLEFIAVKRSDNKMWAIPGAITLPGEHCWDILNKYFTLEALGSLMDDPDYKAEVEQKLKTLSETGVTLYKGYADDPRNTDNAWLETCVVNYHDHSGEILQHFDLRAGAGTSAVSWLTVSSKLALHGSHLFFLKLAADKHGASF